MTSEQALPTVRAHDNSGSHIPSSQETIWDYAIEPPLDPSYLQPFELSDNPSQGSGSQSALSSAPSGLLTPSLQSRNVADDGSSGASNEIFNKRKRMRKSWVYKSENRAEYTTLDKRTCWRCSRCKSSFNYTIDRYFLLLSVIITGSVLGTNRRSAATFSDSSTKNMIEHLRDTHRIGKDGPIEATLEQGQVLLETAFGKTRPQIVFNRDVFQNLLLRWIILNNVSFLKIEQHSFRVLLNYLLACVCYYPLLLSHVISLAQVIWALRILPETTNSDG